MFATTPRTAVPRTPETDGFAQPTLEDGNVGVLSLVFVSHSPLPRDPLQCQSSSDSESARFVVDALLISYMEVFGLTMWYSGENSSCLYSSGEWLRQRLTDPLARSL